MKRDVNIILIGPPGSGKGTQASLAAKEFELRKISAGDLLRKEIHSGSELGKKIDPIVDAGELAPSDLVFEVIKKAVGDDKKGLIFDGFPRESYQTELLDKLIDISVVIVIDVPEESLIDRLSNRRVCLSGETYNLKYNPPPEENPCSDGSEPFQRDDDNPESIKERCSVFRQQTQPVIDFYEKKGLVKRVNGDQEIRKVFEEVKNLITQYE